MAKIKFGMMMTDARGKLGGQVFSKNRSGAYVRTKVTPVNPQTSSQQQNRAIFGSLSANWSTLTQVQRDAWNSATPNWLTTNVFGDEQKPTGKNLFTGLNKVRVQQFPALAVQLVPPDKKTFGNNYIGTAVWNGTANTFAITIGGLGYENKKWQIRATAPMLPGQMFAKNKLRNISTAFSTTTTNTFSIYTQYIAKFGRIPNGYIVNVELREVNENGQLGTPSNVYAQVLP